MNGKIDPFADGRFAPAAFLRLSACATLSRSPNRRQKPCKDLHEMKQPLQHRSSLSEPTLEISDNPLERLSQSVRFNRNRRF